MERKNSFKIHNPIMELQNKATVINNLMAKLKTDAMEKNKDQATQRRIYFECKILAGKFLDYLAFAKNNSLYHSGAKMSKIKMKYSKLTNILDAYKNKYE